MDFIKKMAAKGLAQGAFFGAGLLGVLGLAVAAPDLTFTAMPQNLAVGQDLTADMWNSLVYRVNQAVKADAGGNFSVSGKGQSAATATSDASTTLSTKSYVDANTVLNRNKFTMTLVLRGSTYCPAGYEQLSNLSQFNNNGNVYLRVNKDGFAVSAESSWDYGGPYSYWYFAPTNGPSVICTKTFNSSHDAAHVSFITTKSTTNNCPSGYNWIPHSDLKGNNDWAYIQATEGGALLGYLDGWGRNSNAYNNSWTMKQWTSSTVGGVCFKVMGVDEDPATDTGVYPVYLGVRSAATCGTLGAGWNTLNATTMSTGIWQGLTISKNASIIGPHYTSSYAYDGESWGGDGYHAFTFYEPYVPYFCYKYFKRTGAPYVNARLITSGTCPSGYLAIDANQLKTANGDTGYYQANHYGLYAGGIYQWWIDDQTYGWMRNTWSGTKLNYVCLKIDNAQ